MYDGLKTSRGRGACPSSGSGGSRWLLAFHVLVAGRWLSQGVTFQGQTAFYLECDWSLCAASFPHPGGTAYPKPLSTELQERPRRHTCRYDTGTVCKRARVLLIWQYLFEFWLGYVQDLIKKDDFVSGNLQSERLFRKKKKKLELYSVWGFWGKMFWLRFSFWFFFTTWEEAPQKDWYRSNFAKEERVFFHAQCRPWACL